MVPKEFSFLDQNSESITHVFDIIGKAIKKPQFIHSCLNILLLFGRGFGFQMFLELESISEYLSSPERLSFLVYHPANAGSRSHTCCQSALVG
jgi:hypothetical protein